MKVKLTYDFAKFQPQWGGSLKRLYGEYNDGALVEAESIEAAKSKFCNENNLNPFYVKAVAAK